MKYITLIRFSINYFLLKNLLLSSFAHACLKNFLHILHDEIKNGNFCTSLFLVSLLSPEENKWDENERRIKSAYIKCTFYSNSLIFWVVSLL